MKALTQYIDEWKLDNQSLENIDMGDFCPGGDVYIIYIYYPLHVQRGDISMFKYKIYDVKHSKYAQSNMLIVNKAGTFFKFNYTETPGIGYTTFRQESMGTTLTLFIYSAYINEIKNVINYIIRNETKISIKKIFKILNLKCPFSSQYDSLYKRNIIPKDIKDIIDLRDSII